MAEKLITLSDAEIDALSIEELRKATEEFQIGDWSSRRDILTFEFTDTMVTRAGVMAAYGTLIDRIRTAYEVEGEEVKVTSSGGSVRVSVWESEGSLRSTLKYTRKYRAESAAKAAAPAKEAEATDKSE